MSNAKPSPNLNKSACILCSINCGLEIETGGESGRELVKIKADKSNPLSQGYLCNKAARLNHYQMGADRIDTPLKRQPDGSYQPVSWAQAIREVAQGLQRVKTQYGGDKILFIGGGGQGNHLGGLYSDGLQKTLGVKFRTNALAQEKTGEFWVSGKMFGGGPHGDFEHTEVAVFIGKNPYQSHGFPRSRVVLKEIAKDPNRAMVVIDPVVTDTAKLADYHLQVKPGTDAWCLSAIVATIIQEGLVDHEFVSKHTTGYEQIKGHFEQLSIGEYAGICAIDEARIRAVARRIAEAQSTAVFEDLGVQQNVNSTLVSYLQRLMWVLTGNFAKQGGNNIAVPLLSLTEASKGDVANRAKGKIKTERRSPVLGSKIIVGLLPCNEIADEILTDHPDRFRGGIIESANPVHSYANSKRMKEAIRALEFSVVIDVAMTETARQASYVLPASSSYEKHECVFFQIEFPENYFQLRHPIVAPLTGTLAEPEIHTRLLEELGAVRAGHVRLLRWAAKLGRKAFAATFLALMAAKPELFKVAPSLLYRSLGTTLDGGKAAAAAPFWAICHQFVKRNKGYAANAGFNGTTWQAAEKLFNTLISRPQGFIFSRSDNYQDSWQRMSYADKKIRLHIEELFPQLASLDLSLLPGSDEFPLVLSAGQRRGTTSNTIIRDPSWDKRSKLPTLAIHPDDAAQADLNDGDWVRVHTKTGNGVTTVALDPRQRVGNIGLPNGTGVHYRQADGKVIQVGIAPNDLTSTEDKDFFAGTPWHKYVPARLEKLDNEQSMQG